MKRKGLFILLLIVIASGGLFYVFFIKELPSLEELENPLTIQGTKVYASDNVLIGEFKRERGGHVSLKEVSDHLIHAVIATEDARFFTHRGIDYASIVRAFLKDVLHGELKEGGSTITQQLARILYLSHEKTLKRKIKEAIIAYRLERKLSKEEILELYLNKAYFGRGAYGVAMASRNYFDKSVKELTIKEAAFLVGLLRAPNRYSPLRDMKRAENRAKVVLMRMEKEGYLRRSERKRVENMPLQFSKYPHSENIYGYFLSYIKIYLEDRYGSEMLYKGGLRVYTTLRRWAQIQAYRVLQDGLKNADKMIGWRGPLDHIEGLNVQRELESIVNADALSSLLGYTMKAIVLKVDRDRAILRVNRAYAILHVKDARWAKKIYRRKDKRSQSIRGFSLKKILSTGDVILVKLKKIKKGIAYVSLEQEPLIEGALIAVEPDTGSIEAMVGGYNFRRSQFNRAVYAKRQAGSAFKPFVYALAFQRGFTPSTIVRDEPVSYLGGGGGRWTPVNYDRKFHGPVSLRGALVHSLNVSTVKVAESIGVKDIVSFTKDLGIQGSVPEDLSLSLGSLTVSPMELVMCYTPFVVHGKKMKPLSIQRVVSSKGVILEENWMEGRQVVSPGVAFLITNILKDAILLGTGEKASGLAIESAGKTGTTDNFRDAWFVGYTPSLLAGVWVGYDDGRSLGYGMSGGRVAAPIWYHFMRTVVKKNEKKRFERPESIVKWHVDRKTGLRVLSRSEDTYEEYFVDGKEPEWEVMIRMKRFFKKIFRGKR